MHKVPEKYELIIIGGGPAGLLCAWWFAKQSGTDSLRVLVLEKNAKCGKKLLVSGSGRCNLTNSATSELFFRAYGKKDRFVRPCLLNFSSSTLQDFFSAHGLPLVELHNGKIFPESGKASDVLRVLLDGCASSKISLRTDSPVSALVTTPEGFLVSSNTGSFLAPFLVIATGGASWPVTGSTGDGWALAASLGHHVVDPRPALAPVFPRNYDCASCSGYAIESVALSLWRKGKKIGSYRGDVLFTHEGLSGPGILDFSRDFFQGDEIRLDLFSLSSFDLLGKDPETVLLDLFALSPKKTVKNVISANFALSEALMQVIFSRIGIDPSSICATFSRTARKALAVTLSGFGFIIGRIGDFSVAMATAGGIDTSEVNPKTMESRLVPGLHFAGEVLDVDGDTGGYNLQFAFSSGVLAAEAVRNNYIMKKATPSSG